ncbi:hypothetical protein VB714_04030 [Spirulina sp. 06S082]|nr:hypothetical protein [Spirulina sp. 06S082]
MPSWWELAIADRVLAHLNSIKNNKIREAMKFGSLGNLLNGLRIKA